MRGRGPAAGLALLLAAAGLAGCMGERPSVSELPVTTPPPSATAGGQTGRASASPVPTPASPVPTSGSTARPAPSPVERPLAVYRALASDWQLARSRFFTEIASGRPRPLAEQHALAAAYLAGLRRFAAGIRARTWPAAARPAVTELLAANARQQTHLVAMTRAPGPAAFTERLADYGVDAARETRAVTAVERALGG